MFIENEQSSLSVLSRFELIRSDPFEFLKAVRTLDPSDQKNPIKPFPTDLAYIKIYARVWQKKPHLLVPKSRRMKMSWLNIALYTWATAFFRGRHNAFVSKKEEDSNELIKRATFILENLDPSIIPKELIPPFEPVFNKLSFKETDSIIQGFPSGADQLRQYTFSGILADEMAFWDNAEQMYSASLPTLEGGGKFTGVSTAAPGFFKQLVFDDINHSGISQVRENVKYPHQGIELWDNPINKFTVCQLHYSADPEKAPDHTGKLPARMQTIKDSMPIRRWNQEYEIVWDSFEGLPVFIDWDATVHGVKGEIDPHIGLPLLLGFDWGLTPACIVCQLHEEKLVVMREFVAQNMGARRFLAWLVPHLRTHYPRWSDGKRDFICYIDPSGQFRKDTDESTCAMELNKAGFDIHVPGAIGWEERKSSIDTFLTRRTRQGPCLAVSLPNCPTLVQGFHGGYHYSEKALETEPNKLRPEKNRYSHVHDALQMVASRILVQRGARSVPIPKLSYSWEQNR